MIIWNNHRYPWEDLDFIKEGRLISHARKRLRDCQLVGFSTLLNVRVGRKLLVTPSDILMMRSGEIRADGLFYIGKIRMNIMIIYILIDHMRFLATFVRAICDQAPFSVVYAVWEAYPGALFCRCNNFKTPLHCAFRWGCSNEVRVINRS